MNFLLFVTPTEVTKLLSSKPFIVELLCSMDEHTQLAMALSLSMMDNKEQGSTAINLPTEEPAPKPKKRSRKKKKTDEDLDEHTRIAMAMSASLADETKQKNKDLGKNEERPGKKPRARAKGKLKKVHQEFPVLLTRQDEERQKILAERISDILESSRSEDFISSEHVFQPSRIRTKYLNPDSRPLTETYPGNIKIKSGLQLWDASGVDLSKKKIGKSPFYVEQLQHNIVPLTPKNRASPTPHQVSIKTPCKQSPKSAALDEASAEESMSMTQSLGMTVQCLAELAEEGLQDSMSLSSDKCGFIPQEIEQRAESPETRLSDDQITLLEELSSLVNSRTMSDAVIQIDDGSKLHVHSFMIQLRCPPLAALLAKSLGRNSTSLPAIVVSDIGYEAMENVLSYIYSANITITTDTASEINRFAERFEMAELASHCKPYLQDETVSNAAPKRSELDIVDKDLNQLIDSLWEDEDEEKENEKHGDAGRTSDDDMDETLNDDEIKEICDVVSSQGVRSRTGISDNEGSDILEMEIDYPRVSSPKKMENTDDREVRDEDSEEEEVMDKMMLTQGCRRSDSGSYCSHRNVTDEDDEDWSMALEDDVILQGETNTPCVRHLAKGMTDEVKEKIGENLQDFHDIADNIPEKDHRRRRKVGDSSSSGNDTITDEPNNRTLEGSIHSLFDETLVPENNTSAASVADDHKPRQTSPENLKITDGDSKDAESCHGLKILDERLLDDRVDRSESPDDEVLLLRTDSAKSESDGQSRNLRKSQRSLLTGTSAERFCHEEKESSIDDTGQRRRNSSKRKKLLIQQYSPQSDSDDSHSPLDLATSCHGDEIQVMDIEEKKSGKDVDGVRMPSLVLKKLSVALAHNRFDKDSDGNKERLVSQSSSTEHPDSSTSRNRLDSLDGSLSEDILSPSPPPSPRFTRASQISRVEKLVEDRRSPVNMSSPSQWNHCRSLNASPSVRKKSLLDEDDPYELSTSSSASSGNGRKHSSSCKRKKLKKVKRDRPQCDSADNLSSPRESSTSSKDTKRRWSTLRRDHDLPSHGSRDVVRCEAQVMVPHELSPSPTSPDRISQSSPKARSPVSVGSPALGASPVLSRSPAVSKTPAASRSPGGSCRESPYSAMQDMDDMPEERFAFDMEEGCGFDDFHAEMDLPHDDIMGDDYGDDGVGDDAEMTHQVEKVIEDEYCLNGNGETSEHFVTRNHQDDHFEEEHEIDLTQEGGEEEEEVEEENKKEEDGLMDSVDHHSPVLRGKSSGSGYPLDVSHREPEEGGRFKNFGTPHVNHSQRPLLDGGSMDKSNGHHKLPQSSRTTPRTSQPSAGAVLRTPLVSRLIEDEYFPPAPITPMPNYDSMLTPALKKELKRFGVKPLSKKKARLILTQIFSYLHQVMPEDESDDDTSSTAQTKPEPGQNTGRSRKGKTAKPKTTTKRGPAQKNQTLESSSDDRPTKEKSSRQTKVAMKRQTKPRKRKKEEEGLDETPTKRAKTESHEGKRGQNITRKGVGTEESTGLDELASSQDSHSSSFDSNKSDFGESIYHDDLEDGDDVMATQQVQDMSTDLTRYITSNKELHQKILNYEVLNFEEFYKELKEAKVKCSKLKLAEFLDHHCITFRHKEGSRQRKPKTAKAKR